MPGDNKIKPFVDAMWGDAILPSLTEYIRIPNKSPAFDPQWAEHGYMDDAAVLMERWARKHVAALHGATVEIVRLPGRTPVILIDIPGAGRDTILLYGHLDKQPEMTGWREDFGPWTPVREDDKLFGRGGADDGYAMYAALTAILALEDSRIAHARCVILIEACEESGSFDLPFYVDHLSARISEPSLVICLDSGCGNYDQLWLTTSLRGMAMGALTVRVLDEGVHSGDASGIVPSSFRIARALLSRLEEESSGDIRASEFHVAVPGDRMQQAVQAASVLGTAVFDKFPFSGTTRPVASDSAQSILNRTWRPQLAVTGVDGLPPPASAGAVMLPYTTLKLSLRLPPTLDGAVALGAMTRILEADPPYGATVHFAAERAMRGWNAPALAPWLEAAVEEASQMAFRKSAVQMGEGGSIPFMYMLGEKFPDTQFVITGVLGPHSNAHGPNEFLHIPAAKRVTEAIAHIIASHYNRVGTT